MSEEQYSPSEPWNDCNATVKPFYYPVEAAIRWCAIVEHEPEILAHMGFPHVVIPPPDPRWPCLRQRTELIVDAMEVGELPHGRDGQAIREHVMLTRRTVRHNDLKAWMSRHYPDQKPAFLFDAVERRTHQAVNADSFRALQVENENMRNQLKEAGEWYDRYCQELARLQSEHAAMKTRLEALDKPLGAVERRTLLALIEALARHAGIDTARHEAAGVTIERLTDAIGAHVDSGTIARHLKKIPDAVETRAK